MTHLNYDKLCKLSICPVYLILSSSSPVRQPSLFLFWCLICRSHSSSPLLPILLFHSPLSCPSHERDAVSQVPTKIYQNLFLYIYIMYFVHQHLFENANKYQIIQKQTTNARFSSLHIQSADSHTQQQKWIPAKSNSLQHQMHCSQWTFITSIFHNTIVLPFFAVLFLHCQVLFIYSLTSSVYLFCLS